MHGSSHWGKIENCHLWAPPSVVPLVFSLLLLPTLPRHPPHAPPLQMRQLELLITLVPGKPSSLFITVTVAFSSLPVWGPPSVA